MVSNSILFWHLCLPLRRSLLHQLHLAGKAETKHTWVCYTRHMITNYSWEYMVLQNQQVTVHNMRLCQMLTTCNICSRVVMTLQFCVDCLDIICQSFVEFMILKLRLYKEANYIDILFFMLLHIYFLMLSFFYFPVLFNWTRLNYTMSFLKCELLQCHTYSSRCGKGYLFSTIWHFFSSFGCIYTFLFNSTGQHLLLTESPSLDSRNAHGKRHLLYLHPALSSALSQCFKLLKLTF